jgi:hypothetical protein
MKICKMMSAFVLPVMASTCFGVAHANTITGNLWHVPESISQSAIPANVPGTTPDITFDVNAPLDFSAVNATVGTWLSSGGAFNISENTAGTLSSLMDNGNLGTLVEFTGVVSVTSGQQFTVTHDDGVTLILGGLDLGFDPGPTVPFTSIATYTGPSGGVPLQLVYGECCGGEAVLQVTPGVPIPPPVWLVGSGLLGLIGIARRKTGA